MSAEYELEHLLLEGHCFDLSTGQPPRGLQFTLGMSRDPLMYDTIVMANLVSSFLHPTFELAGHFMLRRQHPYQKKNTVVIWFITLTRC